VAVERRSGRRVVFGSPGAPDATIAQAVQASCSVPLMFGPTVIGGHEYVDGGVWSLTNADVAPATRGAHVLLLGPTASLHGPLNPFLRAASRAAYLVEASALSGRGARVRALTPDREAAAAIGRELMSGARFTEILAAGYRQGLAL
jgi:NTE family protein